MRQSARKVRHETSNAMGGRSGLRAGERRRGVGAAMSAELFFVAPDELVAGDRVLVGALLRTVITTQPDLDRPSILLVNHDGGTMPVDFETDVQIAPNPQLGECDDMPDVVADDGAPISHLRST